MISIEQIKNFYPDSMSRNAEGMKHLLKEYVQLLALDYLSSTPYIRKITFIGGTNLRLVKGIDRFSEDLDFDCKDFAEVDFIAMSEDVLAFLRRNGFKVEARDKEKGKRTAFRRSLHFPGLLHELGLSGHKDERFMLKLEAQDQQYAYPPALGFIKGCGLFFAFPIPPDEVLCAMKVSALLNRGKGRDYYDVMFLLAQTPPDFGFLSTRFDIRDLKDLKATVEKALLTVDLNRKRKDFEHLLFHHENSKRILHFREFIRSLSW